jgi:hypothetical protein
MQSQIIREFLDPLKEQATWIQNLIKEIQKEDADQQILLMTPCKDNTKIFLELLGIPVDQPVDKCMQELDDRIQNASSGDMSTEERSKARGTFCPATLHDFCA